jgi:hypothetical protein
MKKVTLSIFCTFAAIIIFFSLFGGAIRQSLYVPVTTAKVELNIIEGSTNLFRIVPNEAIKTDTDGRTYVWVLFEANDIGELYFYANKAFVEITAHDERYTGLRNIQDGTVVIVTSGAELENGARVKIIGEYER